MRIFLAVFFCRVNREKGKVKDLNFESFFFKECFIFF